MLAGIIRLHRFCNPKKRRSENGAYGCNNPRFCHGLQLQTADVNIAADKGPQCCDYTRQTGFRPDSATKNYRQQQRHNQHPDPFACVAAFGFDGRHNLMHGFRDRSIALLNKANQHAANHAHQERIKNAVAQVQVGRHHFPKQSNAAIHHLQYRPQYNTGQCAQKQ